jgi:hypothetical protein
VTEALEWTWEARKVIKEKERKAAEGWDRSEEQRDVREGQARRQGR